MNDMTITDSSQATMSSREISELSGKRHDAVLRDIRRMFDKLEEDAHTFVATYIDSLGREQSEYLLPRRECEILVTGYDVKRRAAVIDRWFVLESGKAQPIAQQTSISELVDAADRMASALRLKGTARLTAMRSFSAANCPQLLPMIPDYAIDAPAVAGGAESSLTTKAATALLKERDVKMTAATFNKLCQKEGVLEQKSRNKRDGSKKWFWCVTEKGLAYGKNITSDQSPRETQPHWYDAHFNELLGLIQKTQAA